MQDHILTAHPLRRLADQVKPNRGRYLEPCLTGRHAGCHIRTADSGGKCAKRSVSTGVGICADDDISCHRQSFFRKQCMLNSHLSDIKIIGNLMATCKLADTFAVLRRLDILIRNKVIHYQCDLILIKYRIILQLLNLVDCHR